MLAYTYSELNEKEVEEVPEAYHGYVDLPAPSNMKKWETMCEYLEHAKDIQAYRERKEKKEPSKLTDRQVRFIGAEVAIFAIFFILPLVLFHFAASMPWGDALAISLAIYIVDTIGLTLYLHSRMWKEPPSRRHDDYNPFAAMEQHDDRENDLDEVKSTVNAVNRLEERFTELVKLVKSGEADISVETARADKIRKFENTARDYIMLSYWDGYERHLASGFDEVIMRTSAAWKAYLDILETEDISKEDYALAISHMDTVIDQAQRAAYRNFARVDAKIHGEEHIFDLPDAPRTLSNMEKLSIAAAMAEDAE